MNFNAMVEQAVGRCLRLFYRREWFTATSRGDADRFRAVLLNEDGEIDPSMLDLSAYLLLAGRSGGQTIDDDVTVNDSLTVGGGLDATAPDVNTPAVVARGVASQVAPVLDIEHVSGNAPIYQVSNQRAWVFRPASNLGASDTWRIDITHGDPPRTAHLIEFWLAAHDGSNGARYLRAMVDVSWTINNSGTNAINIVSNDRIRSGASGLTLTGPTAITNGVRFEISGGVVTESRTVAHVRSLTRATLTISHSIV